jgi:hypothetical protein
LYSQTEMEGTMTYREEVIKAYEESLKAYGVTEIALKSALLNFDAGFVAGVKSGDEVEQQKMIKGLTQKPNIN